MRRIIIILPKSKVASANAWIESQFGDKDTFELSVNPSGNPRAPATHAVVNWNLPDDDAQRLLDKFGKPSWAAKIAEGEPNLDEPTGGKVKGREFLESNGLKGMRRDEDG